MPPVVHQTWSSGESVLIRCAGISPHEEPVAVAPNIVLVTFNDWGFGRFDVDGRQVVSQAPNDRVFVFGAGPASVLETGGPGEAMALAVDDGVRRAVADEMAVPAAASLAPFMPASPDPVVWAVAARLRGVMLRRTALSDLGGDQLLHQLWGRLLMTSFGGRPAGRGDGGLDPRRLRRVTEFIEANLAARLSVADLASTAALSPYHFLRSFRRTTGMTPHQFVLGRRMERARVELEAGEEIAAVARRYGFAETWYFRAVYRRYHGFPPGPASPEAYPARTPGAG
ncbi:helix-turn-helix transcriptional regulator [Inquilinus sp. Marseille-Q2685]|uniref:helix-turn-helix transcriptional regulator n=1 Tax=Inquilinus sp. Marseille-Q2685 TaxID=2866581 RepID=UPI001CE3E81C|nr:AraC family transcriptional regulator [Inquilinus sp. Marseille-Q2685]